MESMYTNASNKITMVIHCWYNLADDELLFALSVLYRYECLVGISFAGCCVVNTALYILQP